MTMTMYQHRTQFLSTPSARRATVHTQQPLWEREISIHALREEGDQRPPRSTPSASRFLSTPSARRATTLGGETTKADAISIHALREEGD